MIKLIAFDLWQTLAYRDVDYSTTSRMLEVFKIQIPKKQFVKLFEQTLQTKRWSSKTEAYTTLCQAMGLEPTEQNITTLIQIRDQAEAQTKLYPYTISLLHQLRSLGYKTGLVSNSSTFAVEILKKQTNILDYIDYPLFSFEIGVIKPDLKFFQTLLKLAGRQPQESIMVGDKEGDDVEQSHGIGMNAILFQNYEQLKKDLAAFSININ
ncbi:MAG: HAD-IA family hydrolase [Candidatus Kerfeldbacteria bacterium]|nr:HAD-IA family hydrolase [Candidatus Kerfeldbacteria bacterium]